jgi:hypothetical protein
MISFRCVRPPSLAVFALLSQRLGALRRPFEFSEEGGILLTPRWLGPASDEQHADDAERNPHRVGASPSELIDEHTTERDAEEAADARAGVEHADLGCPLVERPVVGNER